MKALILLTFLSGSGKSDEIKGTMEITALVISGTLPFALNYSDVYSIAQLIQRFIFVNIPRKVAANMGDHSSQEQILHERVNLIFRRVDKTESGNQQDNLAHCSQAFSSENHGAPLFSGASSSSIVTLLEEQSSPAEAAAKEVVTNTATFYFNVPFSACLNIDGAPLISIAENFDEIYEELQKQLIDDVD
ncbi:hypothetical protein [Endozoicomonas sp. 8E]|uniref:hypothetical protein n=1 Tax=Endozoicomonas sp. 8E TaxID=3035692 RepID=UPI00293907D3|nr:hypothetical protein [Endozoicomonas sp. 8E]WOG26575.1 hypothetical protein P6910_18790 [Endozoicomonas sp. 8E]